jgi:hypothetical protein
MTRAAIVVGAAALIVVARSATAQVSMRPDAAIGSPTSASTRTAPAGDHRWEIEGAAGVGADWLTSGAAAVPGPGAPIVTSSPLFPTRQTSSWMFGDGAVLLNGVNAAFGLGARVQPLDPALQALGLDSTGSSISFRVRRGLSDRFALELSVDVLSGSAHLSDTLVSATASARDSTKAALTALLSTGPFTNVSVDGSSSTANGTNREIATTGALVWRVRTGSSWSPYATMGAGVLAGAGDLPSATIQVSYRASILGSAPIAEADHVTLHYDRQTAFVGVLGGGIRHDGSSWGWRADGRVLVGGHSPRLLLDASPSVTTGTPAAFIESFTNPAIQFSNNASTGRQSTLSGAAIQDFDAVSAGRETRLIVTFGVFKRF